MPQNSRCASRSSAQRFNDLLRDEPRLLTDVRLGFTRGRILLVDEYRRILHAETLTLRFRQRRKRLVNQNDGRYPFFPSLKSVAHGGAGAGTSGADADDEIVDRGRELRELRLLE